MKPRLHIREQLCLLIAFTTLSSLAILAASVWIQTHHFMQEARADTLSITANLKATQIAQAISLFRDAVRSISTRENLQSYVRAYNDGNQSEEITESMQV